MTSGLPPVRLTAVEEGRDGGVVAADAVIGIDVSDSFGDPNHHVVTAVHVRRTEAESLLEELFDIEMLLWLGKWSQFNSAVENPHDRIRRFARRISDGPFSWSALYYEGEQSSEAIAAATGITAGQAIARSEKSSKVTRGVLVYDGGQDMLGKNQRELRRQATESFNDSFVKRHHEVTIASLVKADEKYPEVAAADLLGGHIRESLANERNLANQIRTRLGKIGATWSPPRVEPAYKLFQLANPQFRSSNEIEARIVAWLRGRTPESDVAWSPNRFESIIDQEVVSESVRSNVKRLPKISPVTRS